jgi:tetratricopeptide (TPR) repeat protein/CHAT domain-containing protein
MVTTLGRRGGFGLCLLLLLGLAAGPSGHPARAQQPTKQAAAPAVVEQRRARLKERDRYDQESQKLWSGGKLPEAVAAAEKMLAIEREVLGPENDDVAGSLRWLAQLHAEQDDFATARKLGAERLALSTKLHGDDHWRVADARLDLAHLERLSALSPERRKGVAEAERLMAKVRALDAEGKYQEAVEPCRQALAAYKAVLGEKSRDFASATAWLGSLDYKLGDYAQAETILRQAVDLSKQVFGENHPEYASRVNSLAYFYRDMEKNSQAESLYQQGLAIQRRTLGEKHAQYAITLRDMGTLYCQMGAYAKAEPLLQQALAIEKEVLGDKNLDCATTLNDLAGLYKEQGLYGKAEPLYRQVLEIRKQAQGQQHPDYGTSLNNLAGLYADMQNYSQAEALYREALDVTRRALGDKNATYANEVNNLAMLYLDMGDNAKAARLAQQAAEIQKAVWGEHHPHYAVALNNLASVCKQRNDFPTAVSLQRQVIAIDKEALGENNPQYALDLHNLATIYGDMEDYAKAEPLFRQAMAIRKQTLGEKHPAYRGSRMCLLQSLFGLANADAERGNFAAARKTYQECLEIQTSLFGGKSWQADDTRRDLADMDRLEKMDANLRSQLAEANRLSKQADKLVEESRFRETLPLVQQALKIQQSILGEEHWRSISSLSHLGLLYRRVGDLAQAEIADRRALALATAVLGEQHPQTASALHNLAHVYESLGEFAQAEPLYRRSLELQRKVKLQPDDQYANTLNSLAFIALDLGQYAKCESMFQEALRIRKGVLGEESPQYAHGLLGLAWYYIQAGDYAKAETVTRQAVAIYKNTRGEQHPEYATGLDHLATVYVRLGDYAKAEPLYQEAMAIRKKVLGEQHEDYGISLNNLALLYKDTGQYAKAEALDLQLMALQKQRFGEHAAAYDLAMCNLAELYDAMGKYAEAGPLLEKAMAVREQKFGKDHPDYADSLRLLALHYAMMKQPEKALPLIQQGVQALRRHFDRTVAAQSERQQLAFRASIRRSFELYLSLAAQLNTPADEVYSEVLAWKAPVSTMQLSLRRMRHALEKEGGQSERARLFAELEQATQTLAARSHAVPDPTAPVPLRQELQELSEKIEGLQQKLAAASVDFRKAVETRQETGQDIGKALPADAVLVDFVEYGRFTPPEKPGQHVAWPVHVAAFVVRRDQPVRRIELGPVEPISQAVDAWRKNYGLGGTAAGDLRRLVWEPLSALVDPARLVLISPSGALARLPFAALPGKRPNTRLLEEHAIALIPVPRLLPELMGKPAAESLSPSLLLVGDVDFGADPGQGERLADTRTAVHRQETLVWPPLPGTRAEVLGIEASFRRRFPEAAPTELTQGRATKSAIHHEAGKYEYLHFSTHGFFAPPQLHAAATDQAAAAESRAGQGLTGDQPGLLSGLVLAGANRPAEDGKDDGILTALEVEEMDLSRVQLATLSACETGLGQSAGGEGVLGLQRAFQTAGAKTVVVSLWQVPDEATQLLMQRFYGNLWEKKMPKLEALRDAQLWMLHEGIKNPGLARGFGLATAKQPADRGGSLSPYYWAAFVLSGDWR